MHSQTAADYGRSVVTGSAFAIGWTPCIGPILGSILTMAASSATLPIGATLLLAWSLGLGLPFIAASLALEPLTKGLRRLRPLMPVIEVMSGVLVIGVGILIFADEFTVFNRYFTFGASVVTSSESVLSDGGVSNLNGLAVAFVAGIIAFVSPCCLPLVPAYLGHLAGVSNEASSGTIRGRTFRHSLCFVFGFTLVFVILGSSVGVVGYAVRDKLPLLQKVAGVGLIIMGLNLARIITIPFLYRSFEVELPKPLRSRQGEPTVARGGSTDA